MKTKVCCTKCKSKNVTLIEVWNGATITWEQKDGEIERSEGILEPGEAVRVEVDCKNCNHRYTLRNVLQIDDVVI